MIGIMVFGSELVVEIVPHVQIFQIPRSSNLTFFYSSMIFFEKDIMKGPRIWTKLDIRGYSNHLSIPINQYLPQFSLWTLSGFFQAKFYRKSLSHFSVRKDILSILGNINSGAFRMSCFLQQL